MPSPVIADVGTILMYSDKSLFSLNRQTFSSWMANSATTFCTRSWNSCCVLVCCFFSVLTISLFGFVRHWNNRSTLFKATMKGVFLFFRSWIDSIVCGSRPCMISTTRMAKSHKEDPRLRRLLKDSWPGVSMISIPGMLSGAFWNSFTIFVDSMMASAGTLVAPICCVMPPASPSCGRQKKLFQSTTKLYLYERAKSNELLKNTCRYFDSYTTLMETDHSYRPITMKPITCFSFSFYFLERYLNWEQTVFSYSRQHRSKRTGSPP